MVWEYQITLCKPEDKLQGLSDSPGLRRILTGAPGDSLCSPSSALGVGGGHIRLFAQMVAELPRAGPKCGYPGCSLGCAKG